MKKQQKSKYRFNIIDVLLILVLAAVAAVIYYFVSARVASGAESDKKIQYTVEVRTVDKDYVDNIELGNTVIETVRNRTIGTVVGVDVGPSWQITTNTLTGEMSKQYYPPINAPVQEPEEEDSSEEDVITPPEELLYDYYNVRITIEAEADYTGSSYSIGGYEVVVGENVYFRTPHFTSNGYCVSLEAVE